MLEGPAKNDRELCPEGCDKLLMLGMIFFICDLGSGFRVNSSCGKRTKAMKFALNHRVLGRVEPNLMPVRALGATCRRLYHFEHPFGRIGAIWAGRCIVAFKVVN